MSVSSKHLRQIGAIYFLWETVFVKGHFMRFIILLYAMINITIHVPEIIKDVKKHYLLLSFPWKSFY